MYHSWLSHRFHHTWLNIWFWQITFKWYAKTPMKEYREEKIYLFLRTQLLPWQDKSLRSEAEATEWVADAGWFREEGCKPFNTWIYTALQELTSLNVDRGWWIMEPLNRPFQVVRRNTIVTASPPHEEERRTSFHHFTRTPSAQKNLQS